MFIRKKSEFEKYRYNFLKLLFIFLFFSTSCVHHKYKKAALPANECEKIQSTLAKTEHIIVVALFK